MENFYLLVLSRFKNQESYLNIALEKLVSEGVAGSGFDGDETHLITILYDKKNSPYLLFRTEYADEVKNELTKRLIIPEGWFEIDSLSKLEGALNSDIHNEIQKRQSSVFLSKKS